ncbi:MAG TPA: LysR substrate-binding domain-containing protein [Ktedonobacteraceae bacterium]|nr:LysR substrate-binding domain-containing protein [Ktedonobacteraceae bacterium]
MELRQLGYFVAVAHKRHFTRAAQELSIAQPALSQQIRQLERELGVTLFERTSRQVRLTSAGEALLIRAERILAEVEWARMEMQEYSGLARGRVVIGALQSLEAFRFPALLSRFHTRYPGIDIVLREEATERLLELLHTGQLDLTLIQIMDDSWPPELTSAPVVTEKLLTEELVLVVAPAHMLAHRQNVAVEELRDEPFILFKPGSGLRHIIMQRSLAADFTPRMLFESGELGTVRSLVAEGLGISVLPRSVAEAQGREVAIVSLDPPPVRTILLAWHTNVYHAPASAAFLSFIRDDIREHPWGGDVP